jgi:integrase
LLSQTLASFRGFYTRIFVSESDISADGKWTIATAPREKPNGEVFVLPPLAIEIINNLPRIGTNPYVFEASRGDGPMGANSLCKRLLEADMPAMPRWTLHDLRRTARSLMSRKAACIRAEHAERTLGHLVGSKVARIYDQHDYVIERADALARLAALIERIIRPGNVVPLARLKNTL